MRFLKRVPKAVGWGIVLLFFAVSVPIIYIVNGKGFELKLASEEEQRRLRSLRK